MFSILRSMMIEYHSTKKEDRELSPGLSVAVPLFSPKGKGPMECLQRTKHIGG